MATAARCNFLKSLLVFTSLLCPVTALTSAPCKGDILINPKSKTLEVERSHTAQFRVTLCRNISGDVRIDFFSSNATWVQVQQNITITPETANVSHRVWVKGLEIKKVHVNMTSNSPQLNLSTEFINVEVVKSDTVSIIAVIIGWIYFAAWSISFYPQVYLNFRRRSVVGLSFDFLSYNFTGFLVYGVYNSALYWSQHLQDQYAQAHQYSVIPVQLNDVVFTLHAFFITTVTIIQCVIYERGDQKVSVVCWVLQSLGWTFVAIILIITAVSEESILTWLDFVTYISFLKLGVTLIKYIPQVYMNYRRKSTEGWSIGNVLLDLTGGVFSILQMILLSYNGNDWNSFFGDPTKFGLGLFSIIFDVIFILQHYVWFRHPKEERARLINDDGNDAPDSK